MNGRANPWHVEHVEQVDPRLVERLAALHVAYPGAVDAGVDIMGDPHRETDEGYNWTVLSRARSVEDVVPGSAVVMGSGIGTYLAKVVAWHFEASDDDPMGGPRPRAAHQAGHRAGAGAHPDDSGLNSGCYSVCYSNPAERAETGGLQRDGKAVTSTGAV